MFQYVGYLNVIVFSALQLEQFRTEAEHRRRLIDRGLYTLQPAHLRRMADYYRVVKQKNSLLRGSASLYNKATYELLDVWDLQISELGARIIQGRQSYVDRIRNKLAVQDREFAPEAIELKYLAANGISSIASLADIQFQLSTRLKANREKELLQKRCLTGPHRDELVLEIDRYAMQSYASAGQQRSALLALNLAQMDVHLDSSGMHPIFLFDDFDSELDLGRLKRLLERLEARAQIFLTTTKPQLISLEERSEALFFFGSSQAGFIDWKPN